jgi:ABC-type amino acid transport substrate-binding protein
MTNKNLIITSLLVIGAIGIYLFLNQKSITSNSNDTLVVGTAAGYAPFVSINAQGEYEGFDIDVARALAKQMNRKLEIKDMGSMTSLFMALEQGSIDVIIWAMSITQDRLKKIAMIRYQGEDTLSYPLIFWNKIPQGVNSISDMQDKTICVEPTSAQDIALSRYGFINKMTTEKVDDALLNIQYGKADAAFVEPAIAKKFKNKYPQIQIMDIPLGQEDQVRGMGIAIKQNNNQLIQEVERAVGALRSSGTILTFEKKWDIPS